jgi:hypothetical protein
VKPVLVTVAELSVYGPPGVRLRWTRYEIAPPVDGVHASTIWPSPGVATRPVGTDGGVQAGVADFSAEVAELHVPLLAVTT